MERKPPKPCKYCGEISHQSFKCFRAPKNLAKIQAKFPPPLKPCKWCSMENPNHYTFQCSKRVPAHPGYRRKLSQNAWNRTRIKWKKANQPDFQGYWYCKIKPCLLPGVPLDESTLTLDHVIPRSKRPDLTFDITNLVPAHGLCNHDKGSKVDGDYERYEARGKA